MKNSDIKKQDLISSYLKYLSSNPVDDSSHIIWENISTCPIQITEQEGKKTHILVKKDVPFKNNLLILKSKSESK